MVPRRGSADELITVTPQNRMVGFPYTKYLNAILSIDQAAALLMTSVGEARRLGIPEERWIYWWGAVRPPNPATRSAHGGTSTGRTPWPSRTPPPCATPAVGTDDIGRFDFYSCFPAPVQIACDVLGLAHDDPRGLTVTGGLPYAGGPGSGYTVHSLATMADVLRRHPDEIGMATGNGMVVTKHSAAVLSAQPPRVARPSAAKVVDGPTAEADAQPLPVERRDARGTVDGYTVLHGRDGAAESGGVVGHYDDGVRFVAALPDDARGLLDFEAAEQVGTVGDVRDEGAHLRFHPA